MARRAFLVLLLSLAQAAHSGESRIELDVLFPAAETVIDPLEPALLIGNAFVELAVDQGLDVVLAIDVSTSTGIFAGADIDGDGIEEVAKIAGDDSVIAAELLAAERVIDELVHEGHHLAIVRFSGESPEWWLTDPPAEVVQPLTSDRDKLRRALQSLIDKPLGMTDIAAALNKSIAALGADRGHRERVVFLFTDGVPTRPHNDPAANLQATIEAGWLCEKAGIRVHTFAIGMRALASPVALIQIADLTHGLFMPVERPVDLSEIAAWAARASIADVQVRNLTTGEDAQRLRIGKDGSWSALVRVREGHNLIEVAASAIGGAHAKHTLVVQGRGGTRPQSVPAEFGPHRELLLEDRLARIRRNVRGLSEELRERFVDKMERTRAGHRRELEIRVDDSREAAPPIQ